MREIRTLRAKRRELETELRTLLNGHEGANPGYGQASVLRATAPVLDPTKRTGPRAWPASLLPSCRSPPSSRSRLSSSRTMLVAILPAIAV